METELIDPYRDFMLSCNKARCIFFLDCADEDASWKACPISGHQKPLGGWWRASEEERRIYENAFRDDEFCEWRDSGFRGNFRNLQGL